VVSFHKVFIFTTEGEMSAHADSCNVDTSILSVCFWKLIGGLKYYHWIKVVSKNCIVNSKPIIQFEETVCKISSLDVYIVWDILYIKDVSGWLYSRLQVLMSSHLTLSKTAGSTQRNNGWMNQLLSHRLRETLLTHEGACFESRPDHQNSWGVSSPLRNGPFN
jgi:hypothetical protein